MGLYEIKRMDSEDYAEYLRKILDDYADTLVEMLDLHQNSHSLAFHCEMSDESLVKRVMKEHHTCTTFNSRDDMNYYIGEALFFDTKNIADWLINTRERDYTIEVDMAETIGKGYDLNYKEKEGSVIRIVLNRDYSELTKTGFAIKTAYIDIENEKARFTGKEYNVEKLFDKEKKFKKFRAELNKMDCRLTSNEEVLTVMFSYNNKEFKIEFNDNDYFISESFEKTLSDNLKLDNFILCDEKLSKKLNDIINLKNLIYDYEIDKEQEKCDIIKSEER